MQEQRATAIGTTPTYALTLADTARRKLNIDPARDLYVRKATVAGEPGGSIPATRRRLEEAWGARVYDQVGSTEAGHFVDAMAIIVILIPIIYPLITKLGYDPIWFGAMVTVLSMIAVITPPVGVNAYVIKGIAKNLPLETIFKGIMPYLTAFFIGIILFMAFPQLATFLPSFLRY